MGKEFKIMDVKSRKLVIIFVEDSAEVYKYNEKIIKMLKYSIEGCLVTIIRYSDNIQIMPLYESCDIADEQLCCKNFNKTSSCLYDALIELDYIIKSNYNRTYESIFSKYVINKIDVIGIGRCKDNCSMTKFITTMDNSFIVENKENIKTKYFCLTDDSFIDVAKLGFHSISSINTIF